MDIYLTHLETGDTLRFPMLPEKVRIQRGNQFGSYQTLGLGEVKVPAGSSLDVISWSGMLPGYMRRNDPYVREWIPQLEVYKWLENMKAVPVSFSKKMRLLVTGTPINVDVYLQEFSGDMSGGFGDFFYDLTLVQAKSLVIYSVPTVWETDEETGEVTLDTESVQECCTVCRPEGSSDGTYTVVQGDFLWAIAQRFYGDGSQYGRIYVANQAMIDGESERNGHEKYTIYPGQVLKIP